MTLYRVDVRLNPVGQVSSLLVTAKSQPGAEAVALELAWIALEGNEQEGDPTWMNEEVSLRVAAVEAVSPGRL